MSQTRESFGNYLANIQTSIFTAAFQHVGTNWAFSDVQYEYNLLYYIVSGQCRIRADGEELCPKPGQLVLLPAGTNIATSSDHEHFTKYYCHFTATLGETKLFDLLRLSPVLDVEAVDKPAVESLFQQLIHQSLRKDLTSALRSKTVLLQLLCHYIENSPLCNFHDTGHSALEMVNFVLHFIENHLADKLSVEKLAGLVHFHPHYFIQVFKTMIGCPPMQYITKLRFEHACIFLSSTSMNVNEIAGKVGIEPDYFAKFFKHHSGISPTEYRNQTGRKPR